MRLVLISRTYHEVPSPFLFFRLNWFYFNPKAHKFCELVVWVKRLGCVVECVVMLISVILKRSPCCSISCTQGTFKIESRCFLSVLQQKKAKNYWCKRNIIHKNIRCKSGHNLTQHYFIIAVVVVQEHEWTCQAISLHFNIKYNFNFLLIYELIHIAITSQPRWYGIWGKDRIYLHFTTPTYATWILKLRILFHQQLLSLVEVQYRHFGKYRRVKSLLSYLPVPVP